MENFPGNSHSARNERPNPIEDRKIEPVVVGKVIHRKKSLGKRIRDTFFASDTDSVFGYLFRDVLVPALQATATDLVKQGIEKAVYGTVRSPHTSGRASYGTGRPTVSYTQYSGNTPRPSTSIARGGPSTPDHRPSRDAFDIGEIVLATRGEADVVASKLYEFLESYNAVTVADLKQLIGETPHYTDNKFGWSDLRGVDIQRVREGYLLILPSVEDLQR